MNLSDYEKGEILDYHNIYFLGLKADKLKATPNNANNYGFDDDRGDYKAVFNDHIGYRYEVVSLLGKGSFGQAFKSYDHKKNRYVALKIIRNKKRFHHQATVEVKILKHLKDNDVNDNNNIVRMYDYFIFRKHLVSQNLMFNCF